MQTRNGERPEIVAHRRGFRMTETVADRRCIALIDRAVHEPGALEELGSLFAPDATVQLEEFAPGMVMRSIAAATGAEHPQETGPECPVKNVALFECRYVWRQAASRS
ncbi:hypothetical protein ABZS88_34550 [Streptomyces sp. NPDC005480]|uniref:hypothetical protein n=1 Tax=Streptomyces sp. NPDC005480 TaxID=3154880 RepID=UPI0033A8666D